MAGETENSDSLDTLIADFEIARDGRNRARYVVTVVILAVVLTFIYLGYSEVKNFVENEQEAFAGALAEEASSMAPEVVEVLNDSVNRLMPLYTETFYTAIEDNSERFSTVLVDEYYDLHDHAVTSWPEIEIALAELVVQQEETARTKLAQYVPEDRLVDMSEMYQKSLSDYLDTFFSEKLNDDMLVAQDIVDKLQQIAVTETEMAPEDTQFIMGMIIELLGMQMQINSSGHDSLTQ